MVKTPLRTQGLSLNLYVSNFFPTYLLCGQNLPFVLRSIKNPNALYSRKPDPSSLFRLYFGGIWTSETGRSPEKQPWQKNKTEGRSKSVCPGTHTLLVLFSHFPGDVRLCGGSQLSPHRSQQVVRSSHIPCVDPTLLNARGMSTAGEICLYCMSFLLYVNLNCSR